MEPDQYELMYRQEQEHWWYAGMRNISLGLLRAYYHGPQPAEILDAGCGSGAMMRALARYGRVTGVDIAAQALAFAQQRQLTHLIRASVSALPFPSARFHLVTSFDVLYHLRVEDDQHVLAELHRVLQPGGMLLLRVPAHDWIRGAHDLAVHTRHRYERSELRAKLRQAGFSIDRLTYVNSLLFPLAPAKRLLERGNGSAVPDLWFPPAPMNRALARLLALEGALVLQTDLPWGLSLMAVAHR